MHGHRRFHALIVLHASIFSCLVAAGCDTVQIPGLEGFSRTRPGGGLAAPGAVAEQDGANGVFETAQPAPLPDEGEITIEGTITGRDDIDIYSLGPADAGDRITLDVSGRGGLNTVAALFDAEKNLIDANDDRSYYAGQIDPYLTQVIRRPTTDLYVGVAVTRATYFSSGAGRYENGSYSVRVIRKRNQSFLAARRQTVWLDFDGATGVQIALQPFENIRPFEAEKISPRFAGQTQRMIDMIVAGMRRDFAGLDLVLLDSRVDVPPAAPYTKLYFGNFNSAFLGLSDSVDTNNAFLDQEAIIYTEDFALFEGLLPSVEEVAQAIANTGSHELGHLLGLEHTAEAFDLMATAASARQILETDCRFGRARLEAGVFPAGWQSGLDLLTQNVGLAGGSNSAGRMIGVDSATDQILNPANSWRDAIHVDIPICGRCASEQRLMR